MRNLSITLITLLSLVSLAFAGGNTSIAELSEVHSVKVEDHKITIVGSGFVIFRAMTDEKHQTNNDAVFGQPAQTVHIRATRGVFEMIPYFSNPEIKGVPTGGHTNEELKKLSKKWWSEQMLTFKKIKAGDSITIGYQQDQTTLSEFQVQGIIGAGSVTIHPKKQKAEQGNAVQPAPTVDAKAEIDEKAKPEPPKITHENLYQMEELVEQGADPNAPYWLYPGLP